MSLDNWIALAKQRGASDLHLEPGLAPCLRIRGTLRSAGDPISAATLMTEVRELIGREGWPSFLERRSFDVARTIGGTRCRINVLQSARGVGLAIRLLPRVQPTLRSLNLHSELRRLIQPANGLLIVTGATGSGKTSTAAALINEINLSEPRHIITIENPIEFALRPHKAFIRQREVGRDTPSFEQALLDSLREDPDVLFVGEMRDPETMRLTLGAAETGHLVVATMHSGTCAEALHRLVGSFAAEAQAAVIAQLADSLVGVVAQQLRYRPDVEIRVPECEILVASASVRAIIRQGQLAKLSTALETGAADGSWTFKRYRDWLDRRSDWYLIEEPEPDTDRRVEEAPQLLAPLSAMPREAAAPRATSLVESMPAPSLGSVPPPSAAVETETRPAVMEIPSDAETDLAHIVREMERRGPKR